MALDVGAISGDTSLAEAIWRSTSFFSFLRDLPCIVRFRSHPLPPLSHPSRNVYSSDPAVPMSEIAAFVRYVRREQKQLAETPDSVFENADLKFGTPPFIVPESEKVRMAKEPKLEMAILRKPPDDPLADILRQQYDAILKREQAEKEKQGRSP